MDKRIIGKWKGKAFGEIIDVISDNPLKMKMSFDSTGHFNVTPNCVYEKDGYLCYEINDEANRMVFHIKYNDDKLEGYYTFEKNQIDTTYERISNVPDDKPYEYNPQMIIVPGTNKSRIEILKEYSKYDRSIKYDIVNTFVLNGEVPEILNKYNYDNYIKNLNNKDDKIVFSLFDFVCDNFKHNGAIGLSNGRTITDIIKFCEEHDQKTNCRGLAILLASILRLNGIKAQHITCMPYEDPFNDCHVVVDCLLPSGKRVMLDPTYHLYLKDENGEYVSLPHLREMLIAGESLFLNVEANYNGNEYSIKEYIGYMIKNTFRFSRFTLAKEGIDSSNEQSKYLELIPTCYNQEEQSNNKKRYLVLNDEEFWKM